MLQEVYLGMARAGRGQGALVFGGYAAGPAGLAAMLGRDPDEVTFAPIGQWLRSDSIAEFPADLPLRLEQGAPLLIMEKGRDGQYFRRTGANALVIKDLGVYPPLGSQFAAVVKADCPAGLDTYLFGADRRTVFAIVDGAACQGLVEHCADEGLRVESLFQGKNGEDLAEVAPYLVELPADSALLRQIFTRDERNSAKGYYAQDAALFLQPKGDFDALRRHLRKFTQLPDPTGRWMFLRFWSGQFRDYLVNHPDPVLPNGFFDGIERVFCRLPDDRWFAVGAGNQPSRNGDFLECFTAHSRILLRQRFASKLREAFEDAGTSPSPVWIASAYCHSRSRGYRSERAIARYVETLLILSRHSRDEAWLLRHPEAVEAETYSDTGRARVLLKLAKQLDAA